MGAPEARAPSAQVMSAPEMRAPSAQVVGAPEAHAPSVCRQTPTLARPRWGRELSAQAGDERAVRGVGMVSRKRQLHSRHDGQEDSPRPVYNGRDVGCFRDAGSIPMP